VQNSSENDMKSELPLNLSTAADDVIAMASVTMDADEQTDSEDEETYNRKLDLMSALSLADVHGHDETPPGGAPTSSWRKRSAGAQPLNADWDWNQLTYGSDRKRAKKEDGSNHHAGGHHSARGHSGAAGGGSSTHSGSGSSAAQSAASMSLFEFVVTTSFTDAFIKYRALRKRKPGAIGDQEGATSASASASSPRQIGSGDKCGSESPGVAATRGSAEAKKAPNTKSVDEAELNGHDKSANDLMNGASACRINRFVLFDINARILSDAARSL
jgi:hypothetical protein